MSHCECKISRPVIADYLFHPFFDREAIYGAYERNQVSTPKQFNITSSKPVDDAAIDLLSLIRSFSQGDGVAHRKARRNSSTNYTAVTISLLEMCWKPPFCTNVSKLTVNRIQNGLVETNMSYQNVIHFSYRYCNKVQCDVVI